MYERVLQFKTEKNLSNECICTNVNDSGVRHSKSPIRDHERRTKNEIYDSSSHDRKTVFLIFILS